MGSPPPSPRYAFIRPLAFAREIRSSLGTSAELPAWLFRLVDAGPTITVVDADWLCAWIVYGVELFRGGRPPTLMEARHTGKLAVVAAAVWRCSGSISGAARTIGTSRQAVRKVLRGAGLYPWPRGGG